jgi:hypothetical protein
MTQSVAWGQLKTQADDAIKPLDPGRYRFLCSKAEHRMASTGSHMVVVHLVVQSGPKHGKDLMHNFVFTPDNSFALAMWFRNFDAFGLGSDFFATLSGDLQVDMPRVAAAMIGRQVDADVSQREFQRQMRNNFDAFYPIIGQTQAVPGPTAGTVNIMPGVPSVPNPGVPSTPPRVTTPGVPQVTSPSASIPPTPVIASPAVVPAGGAPLPPDEPF